LPSKETFIVTHTPPSPPAGVEHSPHTGNDGLTLPPYPDTTATPGPAGSDDTYQGGHRSARRPGPLRRLFGRGHAGDAAGPPDRAAAGPRKEPAGEAGDGVPGAVTALRGQHRAQDPVRRDAGHAAQEHPATSRPAISKPPGTSTPSGSAAPQSRNTPLAADASSSPPREARFIPNTPATARAQLTPAASNGDDDGDLLFQVLGGLALRDLTLVESLLQIAEKLENSLEDGGQLGLLFRIDHLATQMRRNSENLLVLAGSDTQVRDREPVPLLDVARAAISEITDYGRAQISALPDVRIAGVAADDLSHILAELLENATSKSPESASAVVRAERTGDGTMVVSVEDSGIGIPPDQLAAINMRLGRPPVIDPSVTRGMGLYMVGRLAQRHGIRVQLRERPYGGITASVIIPARLIQPGTGAAKPVASPGRPARPARAVPLPASASGEPSRALAPPAPPFSPADPATLPRRTPGQLTAVSPPAGPARATAPELHHSNGLPRPGAEPGQLPDQLPGPGDGQASPEAEPT
jgi:Histidine kinase-, DNA gyrase B-, and HSP90-like ATPase